MSAPTDARRALTLIDARFTSRNLRGSVDRYRVVLAFIAVAAAFLVLLSGVVGQGASALAGGLSKNSAVSSIELQSASPSRTPTQLTESALGTLARLPHVVSVDPWDQTGIMPHDKSLWMDSQTPSVLWTIPRIAYAQPKVVAVASGADAELIELGPNDIMLPDTLGDRSLRATLGKSFVFDYTLATGASSGIGQEIELRVVGLFDHSVPGADGLTPAYVSPTLAKRLIAARLGLRDAAGPGASYAYPHAFVNVDEVSHVAAVQARLARAGYEVTSVAGRVPQLPGLLRLLSYANLAIAVILALFCLGSGISIGSALLAQRGREIGLLRALGWTRGRVFRSLIGEITSAGLLVGAVGAAAGLMATMAASRLLAGRTVLGIPFDESLSVPAWYWFAGILIGLPLALAAGAVRPLLRLARIAPDDALRRL